MNILTELFVSTIRKCNFEDVQYAIKTRDQYIIINTLPQDEQACLLTSTVSYHMEEKVLNDLLEQYSMRDKTIIIYGRNSSDSSSEKKYKQLVALGFSKVYLYSGGLFEWLLLQDIYGSEEFPTTSKVLDLLKFRVKSLLR